MLINNLILLPTFAASTISPQDCCNSTPSPYPLYLSSAQWPEGSCWNVRQITSLLYYKHSSGFHPNAREKVTTFIKRCMTWNPAPPTHTLLSDCSSSSLSPSWLRFSQNLILAGQVCCLRAFAWSLFLQISTWLPFWPPSGLLKWNFIFRAFSTTLFWRLIYPLFAFPVTALFFFMIHLSVWCILYFACLASLLEYEFHKDRDFSRA